MMQHKTLDRLTLQNLINAYCFETGRGDIIAVEQQDDIQKQASKSKPLLVLMLLPSNTVMVVPVDRVSQLGQHRLADTPLILNKQVSIRTDSKIDTQLDDPLQNSRWIKSSAMSLASLIIEDIVHADFFIINAFGF